MSHNGLCACGTVLYYVNSIESGQCSTCRKVGEPQQWEQSVAKTTFDSVTQTRWTCSACGLQRFPSEMDTSWRWTGAEFEHKCDDAQAGHFQAIANLPPFPEPERTMIEERFAMKQGGHPEFYRIVEEMKALHEKKAADYGLGKDVLANCRGSTDFGMPAWVGVAMRMNDKMTRLKSFAQKGTLANESVEDSLIDLANYAVLALILYREVSKS